MSFSPPHTLCVTDAFGCSIRTCGRAGFSLFVAGEVSWGLEAGEVAEREKAEQEAVTEETAEFDDGSDDGSDVDDDADAAGGDDDDAGGGGGAAAGDDDNNDDVEAGSHEEEEGGVVDEGIIGFVDKENTESSWAHTLATSFIFCREAAV